MPSKYTHMLPSEVKLWDRYIAEFGLPEGEVVYDLHLGEGAPIDPSWPSWMARAVKALSTHRVDVTVRRPDEVLIVELKGVAGMGSVGQLVGYEALYLRQFGVDVPVRLVCVCERVEADMETVFGYYEIEVVVLGSG